MKKFLILAAALLAFALSAQTAGAEPEHEILHGTLEVAVNGGGRITGTDIDCGTDCSDTASWPDNQAAPKNTLTAIPGTGWAFGSWTGCPTVTGPAKCSATYTEFGGDPVTANFIDVMAPTIFIAGYSSRGMTTIGVDLTTSDNDRVAKVEYLLDGQVVLTKTSDYRYTELDVSSVAEGTHQLQVRSFDPTGNNGVSVAYGVRVDRTPPEINLNSPAVATNAASPQFSFSVPATDLDYTNCAIQKQGETVELDSCSPDQWFSRDTPTEGSWEFVVYAEDETGNSTVVKHGFVVDRTAPEAAFTSGPADGAVIEVGNVSYSWSATDGLPVTQVCSWDNGEATVCEGSAARGLVAGTHTFKVVVTDQAGNETVLTRLVTAKKDGSTPDPDPDPDTTDKTAPVIKLVAPKQKLRGVAKALRLNVRCNEACSGRVVVQGKGVKFATRVVLAKAGVAKLKLRPTAKVRKRLRKAMAHSSRKTRLALTATADLKDKAGNSGKASLKFKVAS